MRKILMTIIVLLVAQSTYRVYNKDGTVKGYWKEENGKIEVYDKDWNREGYILRKDGDLEAYDKDWSRKEVIEEGEEGAGDEEE